MLTPQEREFYSRQIRLEGFGFQGQELLKLARVLIVGVGGLGGPAAQYLAAAGVGQLTLIDFDTVQISNLHRQILFTMDDLGKPKADCARRRLEALNPLIQITALSLELTNQNASSLVGTHDLVIDASDNFETRYLLNHACVRAGRPLVSAAILGFRGQLAIFNHRGGACYRCLFPEPPPQSASCAENGVIGALPGVLGSHQALEAIKILLHQSRNSQFLSYDARQGRFHQLEMHRDPHCPECGLVRSSAQPLTHRTLDVATLENLFNERQPFTLVDVRSAQEHASGAIATSRLLPLAALTGSECRLPSREQMIIVYCQTGQRSRIAAAHLLDLGFEQVYSLRGGYEAWKNQRPATP